MLSKQAVAELGRNSRRRSIFDAVSVKLSRLHKRRGADGCLRIPRTGIFVAKSVAGAQEVAVDLHPTAHKQPKTGVAWRPAGG